MEKLAKEKEVVGVYISGHPLDDFRIEMSTFCNANVSLFSNLNNYINRELVFAGVLTDVQHRVSKKGTGWAAFTIEDYNDSYEFRIFNEDYLKFRHFLVVNSFLFVKVFVREGWVNKETGKRSDPRLQFNSFQLLDQILGQLSRKLSIQLDVKDLTDKRVEYLKGLLDMYKGDKHALGFLVYDNQETIKLEMLSRKFKVDISHELLNNLESSDFLYKLN